jgi:hypothetical protein
MEPVLKLALVLLINNYLDMSTQSTSLIMLQKVLAIFGLFFLAISLSLDRLQAAFVGFGFEHDCAAAPSVCGIPIGMLEFSVYTPTSVPPSSSVPISFAGSAVEPLGSLPICPAIRYGANGIGSMGGYLSIPGPGDVGDCFSKNYFLTSVPMYFTAPSVPGTYSFCAQGGTSNGEYMEINGTQCDTYTVEALPIGTITVSSNIPGASWTITGPATYSDSGSSRTYSNAPTGTYTLSWGAVAGYNAPAATSLTLTAGGTLNFPQGNYTPAASINVQFN